MDSTPSRMLFQNVATFDAPGKRPAMPTTAIRRSSAAASAGAGRSGRAATVVELFAEPFGVPAGASRAVGPSPSGVAGRPGTFGGPNSGTRRAGPPEPV